MEEKGGKQKKKVTAYSLSRADRDKKKERLMGYYYLFLPPREERAGRGRTTKGRNKRGGKKSIHFKSAGQRRPVKTLPIPLEKTQEKRGARASFQKREGEGKKRKKKKKKRTARELLPKKELLVVYKVESMFSTGTGKNVRGKKRRKRGDLLCNV